MWKCMNILVDLSKAEHTPKNGSTFIEDNKTEKDENKFEIDTDDKLNLRVPDPLALEILEDEVDNFSIDPKLDSFCTLAYLKLLMTLILYFQLWGLI